MLENRTELAKKIADLSADIHMDGHEAAAKILQALSMIIFTNNQRTLFAWHRLAESIVNSILTPRPAQPFLEEADEE